MRKLPKNKKRRFRIIAIILLFAISIGYAALSTTLTINGRANISSNSWLIYFTNVQVDTGSVTATSAPTTSGTSTTTLNWAVNLRESGDYYEYTVDVKNDGTIDAMIGSLSNTPLTTEQAVYLNYNVTYSDGAVIEQYDKLDSGETVTLKIRVEYKTGLAPSDIPQTTQTTTFTYTLNYIQADSNAKNRKVALGIGDTVNYTTTMNGVTLNNCKVFYIDGDYTTIILGDYLPHAAIDTTSSAFSNLGKSSSNAYGIFINYNRSELLDAMTTKSKWTSLLTGTINGTPIDYSLTSDTNIWAMGSPTLQMYVNSWNAKYPDDSLYTSQTTSTMRDGLIGYYVGFTENPTTYEANMSSKEGYNNTLYYPHQEAYENCYGYWFASPSAAEIEQVLDVCYDGWMGSGNSEGDNGLAFRPVISLPTNILQ